MHLKTIKVMLKPNNKQKTKLFQYAGTARFAYNWAISREEEKYSQGHKFISSNELRKEFTQLKKQPNFLWLNTISNNVTKQAIKDACDAYNRFFKGLANYPKFKTRRRSKPSFYQDTDKIQFTNTHVKVEGFSLSKRKNKQRLNWIKLAEKGRIPVGCKYYNPRIIFDGLNWWLSVGIEVQLSTELPTNEGIGIDLGIKDLAICSNGVTYRNINKTSRVKKLEKKKRRLQRRILRKYNINKKGGSYKKTRNIVRSEKELLKLNHRLTNIRKDYQFKVINDIISRKPRFIVIEDLNIKGIMKNKHLSKAIQQQAIHRFLTTLWNKSKFDNIELRQVSRFFPSSKMCHECGCVKKDLKLSDRTYRCENCGNVVDRDYQASLNLRDCTEYRILA